MASYNAINGTPNNINHWLLTDVLKGEWKFQGAVVSDLGGVATMVNGHEQGKMSYVDAVAQSLMAGCDFSDQEFEMNIPEALKEGKLTEARLDDAVTRLLRIRFRLGEFDPFDSVPFSKIAPDSIDSAGHRAVALKAARESIVLLANKDHLLPLDKSKVKRITVIGPLADRVVTNSYNGKPAPGVSPLQGIRDAAGTGVEVTYGAGGEINTEDADAIQQATAMAHGADVALVFVGTDGSVETEDRDRKSLALPASEEALVEAVFAANPHTVVVEMSAGPLTVPWIKQNIPALLQAWWPGEEGGHAIADVLFGNVNPAGRLPHTVYASESQVPPRDEYDISKGFTYMYVKGAPLYPFGFGLSYTNFIYSNLKVTPDQIPADGKVTVSFDVKNDGQRPGDEVPQLYVHDSASTETRPAEQLRGFQRINLQPGETKTVKLDIPASKVAFWNVKSHAFIVDPGQYDVMVGASSQDIRAKGAFTVTSSGSFPP